MENIGALVRRERLARGWSQEGLCAGICAVSYLSKIEQGKAEPSREVLRLLCQRLALPWEDEADVREALAELENAERLLFAGDYAAFSATAPRLVPSIRLLSRTPHAARAALIEQFLQPDPKPIDERLAVGLDERSLALQRLLRHRFDDALRLYPHAFVYTEVGAELHERGDYTAALRYLERGHALAAEDDAVHLMFRCRLLMGNCHCNLRQTESMRREYERAIRLGKLLNETQALRRSTITLQPPNWNRGTPRAPMPIFPRWPSRTAWICTSWRCAARSWGAPRKRKPPPSARFPRPRPGCPMRRRPTSVASSSSV